MDRPNILLITTDQQRFDALGVNGNAILQTPNLDAMATAGVNFTRAYSTVPSCIAARRTILTGQHGHTHGMVGYESGVEFNPPFTLPGLLGRAGYQTQLIGKLHQYPQRKRFGFDHLILSEVSDHQPDSAYFGQNDYAEWLLAYGIETNPGAHGAGSNSRVARPFHLPEQYHHSNWIVNEALRFVTRTRDPFCPWFLHISFWAPHPPLVPPGVYYDRYATNPDLQPHIGTWVPRAESYPVGLHPESPRGPFRPQEIRSAIAGYYGLVNHIDDCLAYFLARAFESGTARAQEKVWIIFTSDHGDMMGDHQLFRKTLPYEGSVHVPFFIATRNVPLEAQSCNTLVCLEDLLPTCLDLAGVPIPDGVDGKSLLPIVRRHTDRVRDRLFGEHANYYGQSFPVGNHYLVRDRHKYCWFCDTNEEQVFDLQADPYESTDLSDDQDLLGTLRCEMSAHLSDREDCRYDVRRLRPLANGSPSFLCASSSPGQHR